MSSVIKVIPNEKGRAIIKLYSKEFDVTNIADSNGTGSFEQFGEKFDFVICTNKTATKRKAATKQTKEDTTEESEDEA